MRKILLVSLALSLTAVWLIACGESKKVVVPPQTTSFAFMQQAPSAGPMLFSPVLGTFSTTGGTTTFSTKTYVDTTTNQPIAMDLGSIVLSGDGKRATFDLYGGLDGTSNQWDVWVANADGTGNPVQISNDAYEDYLPQFSPDGTKVVFASYRPIPGDVTGGYQWQIVVADASGTGTATVLPIPAGILYQSHPTYSPDGTKLAMQAGGYTSETSGVALYGILLTNADGTNAEVLSNPLYSDACYYCGDELPAFTSDGSRIVFSRDNWNATEFEDIFIMNLDGSSQTKLTDGVGYNHDPLALNISGVGETILFSSNRDSLTSGDNGYEIYSIKTDGTGLTRLTTNTLFDAFSQWWFGDSATAAAKHANLLRRDYGLHRGPVAPHKVQW